MENKLNYYNINYNIKLSGMSEPKVGFGSVK